VTYFFFKKIWKTRSAENAKKRSQRMISFAKPPQKTGELQNAKNARIMTDFTKTLSRDSRGETNKFTFFKV